MFQIYELVCGTPLGSHSGVNSTSLKLQHAAGADTLRVGEIIIKGEGIHSPWPRLSYTIKYHNH